MGNVYGRSYCVSAGNVVWFTKPTKPINYMGIKEKSHEKKYAFLSNVVLLSDETVLPNVHAPMSRYAHVRLKRLNNT